jgi:hypothetical protein
MSWIVEKDLDEVINAIRENWERATGKSISKKDLIKKLVYENENARKVVEFNGIKIKKEIDRLPRL